jgi:hypothetical protein
LLLETPPNEEILQEMVWYYRRNIVKREEGLVIDVEKKDSFGVQRDQAILSNEGEDI